MKISIICASHRMGSQSKKISNFLCNNLLNINSKLDTFLLHSLSAAKKFQIRHIHVEGDSSVIINACVRHSSFARHIHYVLVQIWSLLDSFHEVFLTHVFRKGNSLADLLANYGSDNHSFFYPSNNITLDTYLPIFHLIQSVSS